MTSRAHWIVLICLSFASGCQSLGTVFPWQASRVPNLTMDELTAIDAPVTAAARNGTPASLSESTKTSSAESEIAMASYNANSPPASAQQVDQLVRAGQAAIRAAGHGNPQGFQDAQQNFEQVLSLDAANPSAHHGMAIIADLQKDWPAAEFHYKQSLSANPQDANFLNDLGYSYLLQNRFHEAQQYLNQALSVAPQHERAQANLALLSLKRGDKAGAEQRLAKIYSPVDVQATLARLEQDMQQNPAPKTSVTTASLPDPASPQGLIHQMQQERARAESVRNQNLPNTGQQNPAQNPNPNPNQAQNQVPISVYPPGMFGSDDQSQQNLNSQTEIQYGDPRSTQQQMPQQQQTSTQMGGQAFPVTMESNSNAPNQYTVNQNRMMPQNLNNGGIAQGLQIPQVNNPTQPQQGQPPNNAGQYTNSGGNYHQKNQTPLATRPFDQQQNPGNGLIQQLQPGLPQQHATQNQYGSQNQLTVQTMNGQYSAPNAPLAGLNAGPGSLFPINTPMPQQATQNMNAQQGYTAHPNGQPSVNAGYPQQQFQEPNSLQNSTMAAGAASNGTMYPHVRQTLPAEKMMQMQSIPQHGQNASQPQYYPNSAQQQQFQPASMTQTQYPGVEGQNYQQPSSANPNMYRAATNQNQRSTASGPLEAYEQQLQSLDNQYNQALRHMDGSGAGLHPAQPQY